MQLTDEKLKELLVKENYATAEDLDRVAHKATANRQPLTDALLAEGVITRELLGQAIAESFKHPFADLQYNQPSPELVSKIPEETAKKFNAVVYAEDKKGVMVATDDPTQKNLEEALLKIFRKGKVHIAYGLTAEITNILNYYRKPLETRFSKIISEQKRVAPTIIDEILSDAISFRASDIHFEPQTDSIRVRFRVDGVLQDAGRLPRDQYENILNRIKVQSRLRIDEHLAAQDGSMRFEKEGLVVDLRTSIVPTVEGEKVVLRVLASYIQGFNLADLGLSDRNQKMFQEAADKPFGMILVAGPTGSGKTTTLYALLKLLNTPDVNITSIEDPVEYKVMGANQIQVNQQTGLTFAKGLRSVVRQDPDVILVGEIRDNETADIAVNAALTGHLLLSTFHANDAATAIPRLLEMNIEPFLLASTLEIIVAQRLVRKICEHCRHSIPASSTKRSTLAKKFFGKEEITLYEGKGCAICSNTGYHGRTAIFEIIKMTPALQDLTLKSPSAAEIWKLAKSQGSLSLFEDGLEHVKNGTTTIDELLRVAEPPKEE